MIWNTRDDVLYDSYNNCAVQTAVLDFGVGICWISLIQ